MGRILGLDYGSKRTGVAYTDELQISINPLPTQQTAELWEFLKSIIPEKEIVHVIMGYPTHADGTPTSLTKQIESLADKIKSKFEGIEVSFVDESFSSVEARNNLIQMGVKKKVRRNKESIDQASAVVILKSFLDKKYNL